MVEMPHTTRVTPAPHGPHLLATIGCAASAFAFSDHAIMVQSGRVSALSPEQREGIPGCTWPCLPAVQVCPGKWAPGLLPQSVGFLVVFPGLF